MTTDPTILKRIAGLLALSEDKAATPNEIAISARKAQELMTRHQLTRADVFGGSNEVSRHDDPLVDRKHIPIWLLGLANVVAQHNGCFVVEYQDDTTGRRKLMMIGRAEDVELVRYLFTYLRREVDRVARRYRDAGAFRRPKSQETFRIGCVTAINEALSAAKRDAMRGAPSTAIVQVRRGYEDSLGWAKRNLPGLRMLDAEVHVNPYDAALRQGYHEGSKIQVRPGVGAVVPKRRMK